MGVTTSEAWAEVGSLPIDRPKITVVPTTETEHSPEYIEGRDALTGMAHKIIELERSGKGQTADCESVRTHMNELAGRFFHPPEGVESPFEILN